MFNLAIRWGKAKENPVRKVKFFKVQNQRIRYLSEQQARLFLAYCCKDLKPIVILALYTGMRLSEITRLTWNQIDWDKKEITLLVTKNQQIRRIPMCLEVQQALSDIPRSMHHQYVFCDELGRPKICIRSAFQRAIKRVGLEDFRFHDLRHTFASWLVMRGTDLRTVAGLLGHKDLRMTMRYSHLSPAHLRQAVDKLPSIGVDTHVDTKPVRNEVSSE
jgi:integrase